MSKIEEMEQLVKDQKTEIAYLNQLLKSYEKLETMSKEELKEADRVAHIQEKLSKYSEKELKLRDIALRNVLEVNKKISAVLNPTELLSLVLDSVLETLKAKRGVFYLNDSKKGVVPSIFKNISKEETMGENFRFSRAQVFESALSRKSVLKIMEPFSFGQSEETISVVVLPLIYEEDLLGLLYMDIVSDIQTFRVQDLDLAEIFASQAAISIKNASLYDKIRNQNLELMKLVTLKDQLMGEVSNKMKEPLDQLIDLINSFQQETLSEDNRKKTDRMAMLSVKVENTVNKVLAIQEMEREVADLFSEEVNFGMLFEQIFQNHADEIEKKGVKIEVSLGREFETYRGNYSIMRMIFDELITNAVFYNKPSGHVWINGFKKDDYLYIEIKDSGYGIAMEDLDRIFERFARTKDSATLNERGAGLGLFLAQKFAHYYNGEISAQSEKNVGSTFTVKLMIN